MNAARRIPLIVLLFVMTQTTALKLPTLQFNNFDNVGKHVRQRFAISPSPFALSQSFPTSAFEPTSTMLGEDETSEEVILSWPASVGLQPVKSVLQSVAAQCLEKDLNVCVIKVHDRSTIVGIGKLHSLHSLVNASINIPGHSNPS